METIRDLLRPSDGRETFLWATTELDTLVLVELIDDLGLDILEVITVDPHGRHAGAGDPTSLEQVLALMDLPLFGLDALA